MTQRWNVLPLTMPGVLYMTRLPYRIRFRHWLPKILGHDAVTIRRTIRTRLAAKDFDAQLHAHEYCHVEHWHTYGTWRFLWRYLLATLHEGYRYNAFEIEAARFALAHARDPEFAEPVGTLP